MCLPDVALKGSCIWVILVYVVVYVVVVMHVCPSSCCGQSNQIKIRLLLTQVSLHYCFLLACVCDQCSNGD